MKNYEKYADQIRDCNSYNSCDDFIKPYILKSDNCNGLGCFECNILQMAWLLEDYKEPEVDWSKVKVDTPILVRDIPLRPITRKRKAEKILSSSDAVYVLYADGTWRKNEK